MSEEQFQRTIKSRFSDPEQEPLWATAVNLAQNALLRNCELSPRGLELLCCAILQKDRELYAKQVDT